MMSRTSPYIITLSATGGRFWRAVPGKYTLPYFEVLRAKMILLAADGWANDEIAAALSVGREIVSLWRKRFLSNACSAWRRRPVQPSPGIFPESSCRSRPSPVNCPSPGVSRSHDSAQRTSYGKCSGAASSPPSARQRCGDGSTTMPFGPGGTAAGSSRAIPSLRPKQGGSRPLCRSGRPTPTKSAWANSRVSRDRAPKRTETTCRGTPPGLARGPSAVHHTGLARQGARCMDCGIPFCQQGARSAT